MAERIRMNFPMMEEMVRTFRESADVLEGAVRGVGQIVQMLEDDTLLGQAGDTLAEACRDRLAPAMTRLQEKLVELASDVDGAMSNMIEADRTAERLY